MRITSVLIIYLFFYIGTVQHVNLANVIIYNQILTQFFKCSRSPNPNIYFEIIYALRHVMVAYR
jgi:hypothetical protein